MTLTEAEDRVTRYLNGGGCTLSNHTAADTGERLVMYRMLLMEFRERLGSDVREIERAIHKCFKAEAPKK